MAPTWTTRSEGIWWRDSWRCQLMTLEPLVLYMMGVHVVTKQQWRKQNKAIFSREFGGRSDRSRCQSISAHARILPVARHPATCIAFVAKSCWQVAQKLLDTLAWFFFLNCLRQNTPLMWGFQLNWHRDRVFFFFFKFGAPIVLSTDGSDACQQDSARRLNIQLVSRISDRLKNNCTLTLDRLYKCSN